MTQFIKYTGRILLGVALMSTLVGCDNQSEPQQVSLLELVNNPAQFNGKQVSTAGTVRYYETPMHYWMEDSALNRVELLPHDKVGPFLDYSVAVVGTFRFSPSTGRSIMVSEIVRR